MDNVYNCIFDVYCIPAVGGLKWIGLYIEDGREGGRERER